MKKRKWRGADLLRSDAKPAPNKKPAVDPDKRLGRLGLRKVMRGPDGEVIDLTDRTAVWLVQMDGINEIILGDKLKSLGCDVESCEFLYNLPDQLGEAQDFPKLIIVDARAVGQQTPFFRKTIVPLLEDVEVPCLITGVANETQEQLFRGWYTGPMLIGGEVETFSAAVKQLLGL